MHHDHEAKRNGLRTMAVVLAAAILLGLGAATRGDSIRLHARADVDGPAIRLGDVATLDGPLAERLAEAVVGTIREADAEVRLSLDAVRRVLDAEGVNWGRLSLRGFSTCRVVRSGAVTHAMPAPAIAAVRTSAAAASNPEDEITIDDALTLRSLILDRLATIADADPSDLEITFSERDAEVLGRSVIGARYEIEPRTIAGIGRVPLTIRRYEQDRVVETLSATATVERRMLALVATRTIGRGEHFGGGNVEVRELMLRDDRGMPLQDVRLVAGQIAAGQLREGTVVYPSMVQAPLLVRRGELITVRCIAGGLAIRTVARAGSDGRLDEVIEVRNESTRQTYAVTVTGPREAVLQLNGDARQAAASQEVVR